MGGGGGRYGGMGTELTQPPPLPRLFSTVFCRYPAPAPRRTSIYFPSQQGASASSAAKPARPLALWESVVLGGSSAAIAGTIVFPMDTVKVLLRRGGGQMDGERLCD